MADPIGLISGGGINPQRPSAITPPTSGPNFKDLLLKNLQQVNQLQNDANSAIEDLTTGRRDDVEGVILATQKADNAFRMLQAVRNKVMQAVEEIKQVRV
ncbi:MAG: flagellar hook-basal body complex protein FliE [Phycisphaeraceae bacterium]|nr:flagellar hook-basal body complex protein FliE [Phycisphaeraceae bacterium]MCW5754067.1 flagellar hook-basal body complex protein FliE [Phycisphaeraceae bacterium]